MRLDFQARKTEIEWQKAFDHFWKKAIPVWFNWLEWVLILGVMDFAAQQSQNILLKGATAFSYVGLFFYLQSVFFGLEFSGFPRVRSERTRRLFSLTLSGVVAYSTWFFLTKLVSQLRGGV